MNSNDESRNYACAPCSMHELDPADSGIEAVDAQQRTDAARWRKAERARQLERLARYIAHPPVASERLARTEGGQVRYTLTNRQDCRFARPKAARRAGHRDVPGEHAVPGIRGRAAARKA